MCAMLIGQYNHTLDDKNRVSLPSKFRKELGQSVIVTKGLDQCLFVYSAKEWKTFIEQLRALSLGQNESRSFLRLMLGGAAEVEIDKSGRILVPDHLKAYANLATRVVVAGISSRVELWNEDSWQEYTTRVESQADALAQHLGQIGMI